MMYAYLHSRGGRRNVVVGTLLALVTSFGCATDEPVVEESGTAKVDESAYQDWREERLATLRAEDGWLAIVGLFWLQDGEQTVGWGDDVTIQLPEEPADAPAVLARIRLVAMSHPDGEADGAMSATGATNSGMKVEIAVTDERGSVTRAPVDGGKDELPVELAARASTWQDFSGSPGEAPPILVFGEFEMFVIERGDQFALRVRNRQSPGRERLVEIPAYPLDQAWVMRGRFEAADGVRELVIDNSTEFDYPQRSIGRFLFERDGQEFSMELIGTDPSEPQLLMVGDSTSGGDTYGGGRYLYVEADESGVVYADFNRLYNPPCVFTPFATCPLPPASNRLPFAVEAGERYPTFADH